MRPSTARRLRGWAVGLAALFGCSTALAYYAAGHIQFLTGHSLLDVWRAQRASNARADGTPPTSADSSKETFE